MKAFESIAQAKKYAQDQVRLDEEKYHVAWAEGYRVVMSGVAYIRPIVVFSEPESKFSPPAQRYKATTFACFDTDDDGQITIKLDRNQWELVRKMLDIKEEEIGLEGVERDLLDKLGKL